MKTTMTDLPELDLSDVGLIELISLDEAQHPHSGFQACTLCSCSKFNPTNEYPPYGKCKTDGCGHEYNDHS